MIGAGHARAVGAEVQRRMRHHWAGVGLATTEGFWVDDEPWIPEAVSAFEAGRALTGNRGVEAGVMVADPAAVVRDGLPFDRLSVLVVAECAGGPQTPQSGDQHGLLRYACNLAWPSVRQGVGGAVINGSQAGCRRLGRELTGARVETVKDGAAGTLAEAAVRLLGSEANGGSG